MCISLVYFVQVYYNAPCKNIQKVLDLAHSVAASCDNRLCSGDACPFENKSCKLLIMAHCELRLHSVCDLLNHRARHSKHDPAI